MINLKKEKKTLTTEQMATNAKMKMRLSVLAIAGFSTLAVYLYSADYYNCASISAGFALYAVAVAFETRDDLKKINSEKQFDGNSR